MAAAAVPSVELHPPPHLHARPEAPAPREGESLIADTTTTHVNAPDSSSSSSTPAAAHPPLTDVRNDSLDIPVRRQPSPVSLSRSSSVRGKRRSARFPIPIRVTMADGSDDAAAAAAVDSTTPRPSSELRPQSITNGHGEGLGISTERAAESGQGVEGASDTSDVSPSCHSRQASSISIPASLSDPLARELRSRSPSPARPMQGLSGDLPVVSSLPPPSTSDRLHALDQRHVGDSTAASQQPAQPGLAKKASSGFGALLGRMGSIRKSARSPPAPRAERLFSQERRNTAASLGSVDVVSSALGLSSIADGVEDPTAGRPSLQDQFTNLRRQEEYNAGAGMGVSHEKKPSDGTQSDVDTSQPASPLKSPMPNPVLPPGTAAGMSAGPAMDEKEVNWDLWQQVVYEGPAAVARTSGEELKAAIAQGIPAAIRGVVWQVLAESKNEDLEDIYRTLKARGTDTELRPNASRTQSMISTNGALATDKETVTSDASSTHSGQSTPPNPAFVSPPTSVDSNGGDLHAKLLAEKQKREAAALQKLEKAIKRDLGTRTSYSKYTQSAGLQDGLFGVCKAYALFDEGVGYAQGINFIAMPLLFNMSEEEAFTLLVRLMSKYDLRSLFTVDMTGLHLRLYQFERLLEDLEPAIYCHLKRRHVGPQLYATQWFLTLFAYRFPLQLVLRIYDLILSEGLTAILKFGIVLMQRNRTALLEMKDMSHLTTFLKEKIFDVYIDKSPTPSSLLDSGFFGSVTGGADKELYRAEEMVHDACAVDISAATLAAYTLEWEETQRTDRERETELEGLRLASSTLTAKVKGLEERVQQHDAEHVQMAQDVVRLKVENDSLLDANEGLKLQVAELQKLLDAAPGEVESRLKAEMDRIMTRNIEVQNENRSLKEEMEEMEEQLVASKMNHAQTQEDHDSLKQKWSSVQALINENK